MKTKAKDLHAFIHVPDHGGLVSVSLSDGRTASWPMHPSQETIAFCRKHGFPLLANGLQSADVWCDARNVTSREIRRDDL